MRMNIILTQWFCLLFLIGQPLTAGAIDLDYFSKNARMLRAAKARDAAEVQRLLNDGADVNYKDKEGESALRCAIANKDLNMVRILVFRGARVSTTFLHSNMLVWAVRNGQADIAKFLISRGADVRDSKDAAILNASKLGMKDLVPLLIEKGADVNARDEWENGITPLHYAIRGGHVEVVRQLAAARADLNMAYAGDTPLWAAIKQGQAEIVHVLAQAGAAVNSEYGERWTPLMLAVEWGHVEVVRVLLENGALPDGDAHLRAQRKNRNDMQILLEQAQKNIVQAAATGQIDAVREHLRRGADVDQYDQKGLTPLMWAARRQDNALITLLMESGSDILLQDRHGDTAYGMANMTGTNGAMKDALEKIARFIVAAGKGDTREVRSFLEQGLSVDCIDLKGMTVLRKAAREGQAAVVDLLLAISPEITEADRSGMQSIVEAAEHGHAGIVRKLLSRSRMSGMKNRYLVRALGHAARNGHRDVIQHLLDAGMDVNAADGQGRTPLMFAAWNGREEAKDLLLSKGADRAARDAYGRTAADPPSGMDSIAIPQARTYDLFRNGQLETCPDEILLKLNIALARAFCVPDGGKSCTPPAGLRMEVSGGSAWYADASPGMLRKVGSLTPARDGRFSVYTAVGTVPHSSTSYNGCATIDPDGSFRVFLDRTLVGTYLLPDPWKRYGSLEIISDAVLRKGMEQKVPFVIEAELPDKDFYVYTDGIPSRQQRVRSYLKRHPDAVLTCVTGLVPCSVQGDYDGDGKIDVLFAVKDPGSRSPQFIAAMGSGADVRFQPCDNGLWRTITKEGKDAVFIDDVERSSCVLSWNGTTLYGPAGVGD